MPSSYGVKKIENTLSVCVRGERGALSFGTKGKGTIADRRKQRDLGGSKRAAN